MNKKIFQALVLGAIILGPTAMVGCSEDYDGDINDLQSQIDAMSTEEKATAASLQAEIDQLETLVNTLPSDTDVQEEADAAEAAAIAAAQAAADAAVAAANTEAAKYAEEARVAAEAAAQSAADAAQAAAIQAAAEDAALKATAAKDAAIEAAKLDATEKADQAKLDAIAEATTLADDALVAAKAYADEVAAKVAADAKADSDANKLAIENVQTLVEAAQSTADAAQAAADGNSEAIAALAEEVTRQAALAAENLKNAVSELEAKIATAQKDAQDYADAQDLVVLKDAAADAKAKADEALKLAKEYAQSYTDTEIAALKTVLNSDILSLSNDLTTIVANLNELISDNAALISVNTTAISTNAGKIEDNVQTIAELATSVTGRFTAMGKRITAVEAAFNAKLAELRGETREMMTSIETFRADRTIKYSSVKLDKDVVFGPLYVKASGDTINLQETYAKDSYMGVGLESKLYFNPNPAGVDVKLYDFHLERTDGKEIEQVKVATPVLVTEAMTKAEAGDLYSAALTCGNDLLDQFVPAVRNDNKPYALALVAVDGEGRKVYSKFDYTFESQATMVEVAKIENVEVAFGQTQHIVGAKNSEAVYKSYLKAEIVAGSPLEAELVKSLGLTDVNELDLSTQLLERMNVLVDGDKFTLELKDKALVNIPIPFTLHMLGYNGVEYVSNVFTATFVNLKFGEATIKVKKDFTVNEVKALLWINESLTPMIDVFTECGYTQAEWASEIASFTAVEGEGVDFKRYMDLNLAVFKDGNYIKSKHLLRSQGDESTPAQTYVAAIDGEVADVATHFGFGVYLSYTEPNKTQKWTITFKNKYGKPISVLNVEIELNRPDSSILTDKLNKIGALWNSDVFDAWVEYDRANNDAKFSFQDVYTNELVDFQSVRFTEEKEDPILIFMDYNNHLQVNFAKNQNINKVAAHGAFNFTCTYNNYRTTMSLVAWDSEPINLQMNVLSEICAEKINYNFVGDYSILYSKDEKAVITNAMIEAKRRNVGEMIQLWGGTPEDEIDDVTVEIIDSKGENNEYLVEFDYDNAEGLARPQNSAIGDGRHIVHMTEYDKGISIKPYVSNGQLTYLENDVDLTLRITIKDVFGFQRVLEPTFTVRAEKSGIK